mgnify:CR=1 FL=1
MTSPINITNRKNQLSKQKYQADQGDEKNHINDKLECVSFCADEQPKVYLGKSMVEDEAAIIIK